MKNTNVKEERLNLVAGGVAEAECPHIDPSCCIFCQTCIGKCPSGSIYAEENWCTIDFRCIS